MEMLVVMTVIGLIAGISIPAVSAGMDSVRFATAAENVAAFVNAAVNRAERRQVPVELAVFVREGRLAIYSTEASPVRELQLPDGITIEAVTPAGEDGDDPRRILLLPGGAVPGLGIRLASRRGPKRLVKIDPLTGFPRIESVNPE
jgi:type II secretory pathway pseudopilin PulG